MSCQCGVAFLTLYRFVISDVEFCFILTCCTLAEKLDRFQLKYLFVSITADHRDQVVEEVTRVAS